MKRLTKTQILSLHQDLIRQTGGIDGIRDESLLDSALHAPFQSFSGQETFPSLHQKAARLGFGLIQNHAFIDGNKRIGIHAMLVFLSINGIELSYRQDELSEVVLSVASGNLSFDEFCQWVQNHQR